MKKVKAIIINTLLFAAIFCVTIYFAFRGKDLPSVIEYIKDVDARFWISGIICVFLFISGEAMSTHYLLNSVNQRVKFSRCFLYSSVDFFFSGVTPSATGGQPAQLFFMSKDGLPVTLSTMILMVVTIVYKTVLVVLGSIVLIIRPTHIMQYLEPVIFWFYLGIVLNIGCVAIICTLLFQPVLAEKICLFFLNILSKTSFLKKGEEKKAKLSKSMQKYSETAEYLRNHKHIILNVFFITLFQRLILFSITYIVYRSFGMNTESIVTIITMQGMISVAVDMLPLPGGMGMSEKLFLEIFSNIFGEMLLPGMIASRGLAFYAQLIISAVMTLTAYIVTIVKGKKAV